MYAGTEFNLIDQTGTNAVTPITELDMRPLSFVFFTSGKGPETLTRVYGEDFYKLYGSNLSFKKHGQGLLQAARIIDAGGELLVKRIVATDAKLSNIILVAKVTDVTVQKKNLAGELLYIDATTGLETTSKGTDDANLPVMLTSSTVKWEGRTVTGTTFDDIKAAAIALYDEDNGVYPLFIISDIGRNVDCKRVRITPNYDISKGLGFMMYKLGCYEGTVLTDSANITTNSSIIYDNKSYAPNKDTMKQLDAEILEDVFADYTTKIADISGLSFDEASKADLIFAKSVKGLSIPNVTIDAEGLDLNYAYGLELKSGSDGVEFGTTPYSSTKFEEKVLALFSDTSTDDDIFDVDIHKISFMCDAAYSTPIKNAITKFANFRKDFFFFRDLGLGLTTLQSILSASDDLSKTIYAADYMTSYQVIDSYTKRRIEVTMLYSVAPLLVNHFNTCAAVPLAGITNDFVITDAIPMTINYIPKKTPAVNSKQILDDAKINYANYYDFNGDFVIESLYTSQENKTQLSYINNILAIQEVMRSIRSYCPKNRFKFQGVNDMADYAEKVNDLLSNFSSWFSTLEFIYTTDEVAKSQKIFQASIKFSFKDWEQSEIFDLFAINSSSITE